MGDAGPPSPVPPLREQTALLNENISAEEAASIREVKVLVTGFGPFKSFLINPSWLIASALPDELYPPTTDSKSSSESYRIKLIIHNSAIRVSYSSVSTTVPELLTTHNPDYIFHLGMAAGRDCYTLETRGHRDNYRIKDIDDTDGFNCGEQRWKKEGVPEALYVGWDGEDVLTRWQEGIKRGLVEKGFLGRSELEKTDEPQHQTSGPTSLARGLIPANPLWGTNNVPTPSTKAEEHKKKSVVKLSADAGRFLCEYILFESLSHRWIDARNAHQAENSAGSSESNNSPTDSRIELARERLGKIAFLHVPGWTGVEDINRGVMVAEEAIRALVSSWEAGYRRNGRVEEKAFTTQHSEDKARVASSWTA